jgi:hypothetical protein
MHASKSGSEASSLPCAAAAALMQSRVAPPPEPNNRTMEPMPRPPSPDHAERRAARLAAPRLTRELRTIAAMLRIACRDLHAGAEHDAAGLCETCAGLLDYARQRLANCPYGPDKPTCVNCPIHCYGKRQREAVRDVMRHAGPRMLARHPWLALMHLIDGRRPAPQRPNDRAPAAVATAAPTVSRADPAPPAA